MGIPTSSGTTSTKSPKRSFLTSRIAPCNCVPKNTSGIPWCALLAMLGRPVQQPEGKKNKVPKYKRAVPSPAPPYRWIHSCTTSYWPMEEAVCKSRGTSSSSRQIICPTPCHMERLRLSSSDSLASSLSSDIPL